MRLMSFAIILAVISLLLGSSARALEEIQIGSDAPPLVLTGLDNKSFNLHQERQDSRLLVIVFWATWSENSMKELARLEELLKKYGSQGLKVAAVNVEKQKLSAAELEAVSNVKKQLGLTMPVLLDPGLQAFNRYGVVALPSTVVVGTDGRVLFRIAGYPLAGKEELFSFLEAAFIGEKEAPKVKATGYRPQPRASRYYGMARTTGQRGHREREESYLLKAAELDPQFTLPLIRLGRIRLAQNDLLAAKDFFAKALAIEPANNIAKTEMGHVLLEQGDLSQAEALFRQVLESQPEYAPAYYYLGLVLGRQGKKDNALSNFAKAIELNPRDYKVYLFRGRLYKSWGMAKEAAVDLRRAVELLGGFKEGDAP